MSIQARALTVEANAGPCLIKLKIKLLPDKAEAT